MECDRFYLNVAMYKSTTEPQGQGLATLSDRAGELTLGELLLLVVDRSYVGCLLLTTFAMSYNRQRFAIARHRKLLRRAVHTLATILTGEGSLAPQLERAASHRRLRRALTSGLTERHVA